MTDWLRKFFDNNERDIVRYRTVVEKVNALEAGVKRLSDAELRATTTRLREQVQGGWDRGLEAMEQAGVMESERKDRIRKALDDALDVVLPEAFATVREAARRTLGQRHYDVQLIGGMVCHDGRIGELKTGEGKTLMATLPLYLNALAGKGVHLVTANDYLSKVGAVWMGPVYHLLGMSVGIIQGQSPETGDEGGSYMFDPEYIGPDPRLTYCRRCSRKEAYSCDVTYGTNNEFGFDYLRDNMALNSDELMQRELHYAIVDEVDSILIDEARTPLIISGSVREDTSRYYSVDRAIRTLRAGKDSAEQKDKDDPNADRNNPNIDYLVDEKAKTVNPTDNGIAKIERMLGVPNVSEDPHVMHYITASMKAHSLFKNDVDYVVKDGEIIIVDEFTGRMMFGRRYGDGLHQAIEAKEGVEIKNEQQTLATITFQNLFRLYLKLAGMTGTAKTEEDEFRKIYGLDVVVAPTNRPMVRKDQADIIFKAPEHKYRGIAAEILRLYAKQQPVLVGTRSIEMSELISSRISAQSLQLLAMVSVLRQALEQSKKVVKAKRDEISKVLNTKLDTLTMGGLIPIARELGVSPDPLETSNIHQLAALLDLPKDSETLDKLDEALRHTVPHRVLNAKYHEKEAVIIAEAGRKGAVTIATNMAGRGVDILLGGKPHDMELPPGQDTSLENPDGAPAPEISEEDAELAISYRRGGAGSVLESVSTLSPEEHAEAGNEVRKLGGLYILGTERHESRRIDNQLRGRAGRQGDPGESRFFVSLEDELMRQFGDTSKHPFLSTWPEDQAMDARILSAMIERAQKKVEQYYFEARKHVLQYDDVMNKQREVIYTERRRILEGADLRDTIMGFLRQTVQDAVESFCPETESADEWALDEMYNGLMQYFPLDDYLTIESLNGMPRAEIEEQLGEAIEHAYEAKEADLTAVLEGDPSAMRNLERYVALQAINSHWMEHLANMDYLREGINLRGYAQMDPLVVYQKEAFEMFEAMQHSIQDEVARTMFHVTLQTEEPAQRVMQTWTNVDENSPAIQASEAPGLPGSPLPAQANGGGTPVRNARKIGRNDPCWCGSGKKYKVCHFPN